MELDTATSAGIFPRGRGEPPPPFEEDAYPEELREEYEEEGEYEEEEEEELEEVGREAEEPEEEGEYEEEEEYW